MLSNRLLSSELGYVNIRVRVNGGCRQGGILSPLLRLIVVDSLFRCLSNQVFNVVGYADDLFIIAKGPFLENLKKVMKGAIKVVEDLFMSTAHIVNASKTEAIRCTSATVGIRIRKRWWQN